MKDDKNANVSCENSEELRLQLADVKKQFNKLNEKIDNLDFLKKSYYIVLSCLVNFGNYK